MAKHIRYFLLISFLSGVISSCSKDESTPVPVSPKLLKEVKTVYKNQITGLLDSGITAFDYNDKSQITKMTFKHDPGSYKVIEYNGDLPITSKDYYNNNLIKTRTNFVSVSGNTIIVTYLNDPAPGTTDSVIFKYSFEGENITLSQTLLIKIAGDDIDTRSYYTYTSGNLASVRYRSFLNGVEGTGIITSVKQHDDKFNPYSNLSPMNQAIIGIGSQTTAHGLNNVLQFETPTNIGGLYEYTYDKDGFALTMKEPGINGIFQTFTYTR